MHFDDPRNDLLIPLRTPPGAARTRAIRSGLRATALCIGMLVSVTLAADVFLCKAPDGTVLYTDTHCTGGELLERTARHPNSTQAAPTGLSAAEKRALATLRITSEPRRREKTFGKRFAERKAACRRATTQLKDLQRKRRRGYSLAEADRLDQLDREYKAAKRAAC